MNMTEKNIYITHKKGTQLLLFRIRPFKRPISINEFLPPPPCLGLLHDYFGNFTLAFSLAGVPPVVGAVVLFLVPLIHRRLQAGQAAGGASPEDPGPTDHMLSPGQPTGEPESSPNGGVLPGYTDVETHI